ncbi:NUDIX hydrolase [Microbacterium sp. SORGH_AS_0862]|uniref:NUDIX domain-containing protein n=1 Tax=Microbacterium sp. SORGH_AS_0862 TaxID=3041789 RepID=UPI00278F1EB2|nr:NUDIX hydrolase [Microbacterium sp. SORGH_AS_0862]MDQ1203938.1 8-oxo-dGTP pyrophosphatase MutT (NUDIX family) [Microbacterium sp. SORGH_AS_0862]
MIEDERFDGEVVDTSVVFHGRVWDVRSDVVRYGDGEIVRDYVDHTGAAAVVAIDDEGRVLLIQQYRHPIRRRDWEIPAGLLDVAGETPAETARRELAEEVDLAAGSLEPLVSLFTSPGGSDEIVHVFLARDLVQLSAHERTDEEADIVAQWVPLPEVVGAILAGSLRNGILISGVLAAAERLRRDDLAR